MNGSMPIFPLEALGQAASSPIDSTIGDGDGGFAETLAAALAASASAAVTSDRPAEAGLDAGRPGVGGMSDGDPAAGADLQRDMVPGSGAPEAVTDAMSAASSMVVAKTLQIADAAPTGRMQLVESQMSPTVGMGGLPVLDGGLRSSTAIATFDRPGPADGPDGDRLPAVAVTGIAGAGSSRGAAPVGPDGHDRGQPLDGPRSPHRDQTAITTTARHGLTTLAGPIDAEHSVAGENFRPTEMRSPTPDGRTQPTAPAPIIHQHDLAGAAPTQIVTSIIDKAIVRPLSGTATSASLRASLEGGVDHGDIGVRRDPGLPPAGRSALEPSHAYAAHPMSARQAEANAGASSTFEASARRADEPEPFRPADAGPRKGAALGSSAAARGIDIHPAHGATAAGPAIQSPAVDAAIRPQGDALGFERLQPALSADGIAFDVERFEPAAALASSRVQAPTTGAAPAAQVALQIARALPGGVERFSVHLQPAELGSVDIQLTFESQGRVSALITAERPETLELLQRDGRFLERSLGDSGLKLASDGLSFALKQDQQQQQGQGFHEQAQARQTAFRAGRAYDDASDTEQRPPALQVDRLRLLDIHT